MPMRRENVAAALKYLQDKANLRQRFERATSLDPQEQDLADIAVETAASFVPGVGQALAARDVERARRANDPAGMAMASMGAIPGGRLAGLLKRYDPVMQQLDVYHGTPHRFPATEANPLGEFDASKIGTGEGAQAYGHGIYFAENPSVATSYIKTPADWATQANVKGSSYRKAQAEMTKIERELRKKHGDIIPKNEISAFMYAEQNAEKFDPKLINRIKEVRQAEEKAYKDFSAGSFYKADLPDEMIDRMLDWDKPLSEQSPAVRKLLKDAGFTKVADDIESAYLASLPPEARELALKMINGPYEEVISHDSRKRGANLHAAKNWDELERLAPGIEHNEIFRIRNWYANKNAPDFYSGLSQKSDQEASERLRQAGIVGIKYLDAGSRGQGGSGTRNFVVFPGEEKKVRILERNGQKAPPQKIAQALEATSKNQNLVNIYNKYAKREIESANKRIVDPDEPYLTHQPISNLKELDELTDPIFNYAKANVLKHIGEQNGFKVKIEGSNVSPSVYAKFTKVDDGGMTDFKVRISDHADVSRNKPAGEKKAYDINPESNGSMEEIIRLLNDPNWLKQFYEVD